MTTQADILAPHFAAIAHQLGRIATALETHDAAGERPVNRCEATSPQGDYGPVPETEAARSPHSPAERHLTVGQLSAEHIGQWIALPDSDLRFRIETVEHGQVEVHGLKADGLMAGFRRNPDTPCTVTDVGGDHD